MVDHYPLSHSLSFASLMNQVRLIHETRVLHANVHNENHENQCVRVARDKVSSFMLCSFGTSTEASAPAVLSS